jgi:trk system potassium uptake protein TrkH
MFDLRPVGYVIGLLVSVLALTMVVPMAIDIYDGNQHWGVFLEAGVITGLTGGLIALACVNGVQKGLSIQQTFLLTSGVWLALPIFGALPFILGETDARFVDAFFEAMSGLTTTGATVFSGLDDLPRGLLLWRSMMQWFGGIGIIVVAMVFMPELRVGGMQIFRSEGFDTMGKILPRAAEISSRITAIYCSLTALAYVGFLLTGMGSFDALNHAMTTLSTGGFSTKDASFGAFQGAPEYVAAIFMILASLPFVRYVQLSKGTTQPILKDSQIRAFLLVILALVFALSVFRYMFHTGVGEGSYREVLFNVTSIVTGTGYSSVDYQLWGAFPVGLFFFMGFIGGCAGSTTCSVKVFRYQLLFSAVKSQVRKIYAPHGVFAPRYEGRIVSDDVLSSVLSFFVFFLASMGVLTVLLALTGLDFVTSISGAATALSNVGPGLGEVIGPSGNFQSLNDTAKWLLAMGMYIGRLELMAVYVIFTVTFWRA